MGLVLYIHPSGHLNDLVVPAGTVTCMNAIPGPKLGRYAFEVSDDEIHSAAIIAIDVHWALALSGFGPLVAHVRRLRPTVPIIVGGVTASHYPEQLLDRYGVDYVIVGDSEPAFVELVRSIRAGQPPDAIANVYARGGEPPRRERMSQLEFDATDCVTADWFPTYERVSGWDAEAFPQGRTLTVSRGCAFRCPECYGSYASTYGTGYRLRSPTRLADLIERAARLRLRNLRLFLAKPPERSLSELLQELAARGPFHFDSTVGFYLCMAPSLEDLQLLERAFSSPVALSMIPPEEHVPRLKPSRLEFERARWRAAAGYIAASSTLTLDAWTTTTTSLVQVRASLGAPPATSRVKVSYAAVWAVTRPVDGHAVPFDRVLEAAQPVWTFYAARALSPALADLLGPYRWLDELDALAEDTGPLPEDRPLRAFVSAMRASFERDHLPLFPELAWAVVAIEDCKRVTSSDGISRQGALVRARVSEAQLTNPSLAPIELAYERDHRGVTLRAALPELTHASALAFVPLERAGAWPSATDLAAIAAADVVALMLPRQQVGALRLEVVVRVQETHVALFGEDGRVLARGRIDLGYFRPQDRPGPNSPAPSPPPASNR